MRYASARKIAPSHAVYHRCHVRVRAAQELVLGGGRECLRRGSAAIECAMVIFCGAVSLGVLRQVQDMRSYTRQQAGVMLRVPSFAMPSFCYAAAAFPEARHQSTLLPISRYALGPRKCHSARHGRKRAAAQPPPS